MNVRKEENQAWKDRMSKIYQSVERSDVIYTNKYLYENLYENLYYDNHFNPPDSDGLNYGDFDNSEYSGECVWYWNWWW